MTEKMDMFFAVFNGHVNNADERARKEMPTSMLKELEELEEREGGVMAIFNFPPTWATRRYAELVQQFVNENCS